MDGLQKLVAELDGMLTGRAAEAAFNAGQMGYMFADAITFVAEVSSNTYYLADGGYSRLLIGDEGHVLGLDSVSLAAVKARWSDKDVIDAAGRLEALLRAAVTKALDGPGRPQRV
jgi:hypothetical protein